jgi:hypothetical protein
MQLRPTAIPAELTELLNRHAATYATHYPPVDNSDHGPMAYLAMHGLELGMDRIRAFAAIYQHRLVRYPPPRDVVSALNWHAHIGRRESYAALLDYFKNEIERAGWRTTVSTHLPRLMSGWVKDAFHPLIRLGYGIEFESPIEIAAGLAYFTIVGDDPALLDMARRSNRIDADAYVDAARDLREKRFARGPFNDRYTRILRSVAPRAAAHDDVLQSVSRTCLDAFDATHDFFALHLVTSSHAYRVCRPFLETDLDKPIVDDLYSIGIATAYVAIGAPEFARVEREPASLPLAALAHATDEHDLKLAYSCRAQRLAYDDVAYETIAARYLAPRLPAAS